MTYPSMYGIELRDWLLEYLISHKGTALTGNNFQSSLVHQGYAAPSIEDIDSELEFLADVRGGVFRPYGKSPYLGSTEYMYGLDPSHDMKIEVNPGHVFTDVADWSRDNKLELEYVIRSAVKGLGFPGEVNIKVVY